MTIQLNQNAAHTIPITGAVAQYTALQSSAEIGAAAVVGMSFDDPDTVVSFFGAQMSQAQSKVSGLMADQEQRSDVQAKIQDLAGQMNQYEQSGVKPGDPAWNDFLQTASDLKKYLTDGSDASKKINAMIDAATTSSGFTTSNPTDPNDIAKLQATPGVTVTSKEVPTGVAGTMTVWTAVTPNPPPGMTADQVKSMDMQLKSVTDALSSDTTMQMVRVQQGVESCSQILSVATNVLKKIGEGQDNAIQNIK